MEKNNSSLLIKVIGGVVVLALLVYALMRLGKSEESVETPAPTPSSGATPATSDIIPIPESPQVIYRYKNGTYTATGNYTSPGGKEEIRIELALENDVVTSATFFENSKNPTSLTVQKKFKAGFQQYVVGKNIDSIKLDVVNGSSLTPGGFMDALAKIKVQASA